jgi:hypothetical protein
VNSETKSGGQVLQPRFHLMSAFTPSQWLDIRSLARRKKGVGLGSRFASGMIVPLAMAYIRAGPVSIDVILWSFNDFSLPKLLILQFDIGTD